MGYMKKGRHWGFFYFVCFENIKWQQTGKSYETSRRVEGLVLLRDGFLGGGMTGREVWSPADWP